MKLAIVAPEPIPKMWGGTERAVDAMRAAIEQTNEHEADVVKLGVDESNLPGLIDAYRRFSNLDVTEYDRVISVKYPAWMIDHPDHIVHMFHPLRGLYDSYGAFGLPLIAKPHTDETAQILDLIGTRNDRTALHEFFWRFEVMVDTHGPNHPDLAFPGPFARAIVHWLDAIALTPPRAQAHFAISATVAARPEYFPRGLRPLVLPLPSDLPLTGVPERDGTYLFTASRLEEPKRIGLLIDAMAHVRGDVTLKIAGIGSQGDALRERAKGDPRIEFLDFVTDDELIDAYRGAIAVPFVPDDEDQGLICVEAASQGTPVVTCTDSGGPTEFVTDGVSGLIVDPTPGELGRALDRVCSDPSWARRMGRAAYRRASIRNWSRAVATLIDHPTARGHQRTPGAPQRSALRRTAGLFRHRPRAVVLTTYGIDRPGHGGELRVHHLCRSLAPHMDVDVLALVAEPGETTTGEVAPGLTSTMVPRSRRQIEVENELGSLVDQPITDILAGIDAHFTPEFLDRLRSLTAAADLVILAQPFLHPALARAHVDLPYLVDTQNVEFDLRAQTLANTTIAAPILEMLRRIEGDALRDAIAVSACSNADADRLAELYGLDRNRIAVIPNGTVIPKSFPDPSDRLEAHRRWFDRLHWTWALPDAEHLGVFFGSWHPPNIDAAEFLIELAGDRRDLVIISAGNHGLAFGDRTVPPNIVFPGIVSESVKTSLLAAASVALNPMRTGSGTNLKLIEFLGHGVPTVTTAFGARGLPLTDGRELLFAEPNAFSCAIDRVLDDSGATALRTLAGWELAQRYSWNVIGDDYRKLVGGIVGLPLAA